MGGLTYSFTTSTGSRRKTNTPLIIGNTVSSKVISKAKTETVMREVSEEINLGVYKLKGFIKVVAITFQRLIARTPMDEDYDYLNFRKMAKLISYGIKFSEQDVVERHIADNDVARFDWVATIKIGSYVLNVKAKRFENLNFKEINDAQEIKIIYNYMIDHLKRDGIKLTNKGFSLSLSVDYKNNNSHFKTLEMGGYKRENSLHEPYEGTFFLHGITGHFSVQAPAGIYRVTMAEFEESIAKVETKKKTTLSSEFMRHCLKDITYQKMQKHYEEMSVYGGLKIKDLKNDDIETAFRKVSFKDLIEYAMQEVEYEEEIIGAKAIRVDLHNAAPTGAISGRSLDAILGLKGKDGNSVSSFTKSLLREYGISEDRFVEETLKVLQDLGVDINDPDMSLALKKNGLVIKNKKPSKHKKRATTREKREVIKREDLIKVGRDIEFKALSRYENWRTVGRYKYLTDEGKAKVKGTLLEMNKKTFATIDEKKNAERRKKALERIAINERAQKIVTSAESKKEIITAGSDRQSEVTPKKIYKVKSTTGVYVPKKQYKVKVITKSDKMFTYTDNGKIIKGASNSDRNKKNVKKYRIKRKKKED